MRADKRRDILKNSKVLERIGLMPAVTVNHSKPPLVDSRRPRALEIVVCAG